MPTILQRSNTFVRDLITNPVQKTVAPATARLHMAAPHHPPVVARRWPALPKLGSTNINVPPRGR
jgi:hypothetical protein